jgi:universal stress protein A
MYQHILLALENDTSDQQLLSKAYALAGQHNARLSLLHVIDFIPNEAADPMGMSLASNAPQQLLNSARQQLENRLRQHPAPEGLLVDTHVTLGAPRHEIVTQAKSRSCDLIITGHHSHRGLGHLLGHTDESVLHHAPCDLLAINLSN